LNNEELVNMLTAEDFKLTDAELAKINEFIRLTAENYYKRCPDEDPLDQVSVIFEFAPGIGRGVTTYIAGKHMELA